LGVGSPPKVVRQPDVELIDGSEEFFLEAAAATAFVPEENPWFQHGTTANGDTYLRWDRLFEFVVSADGKRIYGRKTGRTSLEAFHTYLLGQVLSYALVQRGIEPLHATTVVVDGQAVALVGHSGQGKSTLAAAFLQRQVPLLTDDLLVLEEAEQGWRAAPGLPRIKLYPEAAKRFLNGQSAGARMNTLTRKLIIPLRKGQHLDASVPLRVVYVLKPAHAAPGRDRDPRIRRLSPQRAFVALTTHTFNDRVLDPQRLKRQFAMATRLASSIPVRSVSYVRDLRILPRVREAILSDLMRVERAGL